MVFGHEEIIQVMNRQCRIVAQTNCALIYLNKDDFEAGIFPSALKYLSDDMIVFNVDAIADKITSQYKKVKLMNNALLNATKVNSFKMNIERGMQLMKDSAKIQRLEPWLSKVRGNKTKN